MTRDIQTLTTPIIIPDSTTPLRKPELTKQFHPLPFPSFYRLIRSCMIYRIPHKYTLVHEYIPDTFYRCKMIFIKFHNILIGEYNAMKQYNRSSFYLSPLYTNLGISLDISLNLLRKHITKIFSPSISSNFVIIWRQISSSTTKRIIRVHTCGQDCTCAATGPREDWSLL